MQQILLKVAQRLTPNQKKFIAEVLGTFIVVVFATGSVVIDAKLKGALGIPFIAFAPFVGGSIANLWLYWTATFIGTSTIAIIYRIKFGCWKKNIYTH